MRYRLEVKGALWILGLICLFLNPNELNAQEWRIYAAYSDHTKAVKVGSKIFTVSDGGLFSYDKEDEDVRIYNKVSPLTGGYIFDIAPYGNNLIILYNDGDIDILSQSLDVYNMPELKEKNLSDKTLNELRVFQNEAVISTNSGLVIINLRNRTFSELYDLGEAVKSCIIKSNAIYAKTATSVFKGDKSKNLQDLVNWEKLTLTQAKQYVDFDAVQKEETQTNETNLKTVEKINPEGPRRNYFYKMNFVPGNTGQSNRLLVAGGCFNYPSLNREGTIMMYEDGKWTYFDEDGPKSCFKDHPEWYRNVTDVVQDPDDPTHHFASLASTGLFEFKDGKLKCHYTYQKDSPLMSILPNDPYSSLLVRVTGLAYDDNKNLWMLNNECDTIVRVKGDDGKWYAYYYPQIKGFQTFDQIHFDERGWAWINCRRTTAAGNKAGVLVLKPKTSISQTPTAVFLRTLVNQDGKSYTDKLSELYCITEDVNGEMWVGTNQGPFVIKDPANIASNTSFYQVKVPRNDGTDLADYLLNEVAIKCIAVDGANRKWFGTVNNGVYLTSADGTEILQHFTKDNSPLLSDDIYTIAIDGRTGEVFIGTGEGLCSYMSDAVDPVEKFDKDLVKVYPNPVKPDYSGDIKITGLMNESHVKIVSANGRLVNKGVSIGGAYTWNGRLDNGKQAMSGIYYILATDPSGEESVAGKFLIVR